MIPSTVCGATSNDTPRKMRVLLAFLTRLVTRIMFRFSPSPFGRALIYLTHPPCGLRVDWSYVRVFSWFALQMNHENQTTKSHEPGITKRHKGSADESSMLLPLKRLLGFYMVYRSQGLSRGVNERTNHYLNY